MDGPSNMFILKMAVSTINGITIDEKQAENEDWFCISQSIKTRKSMLIGIQA